MTNNSELPQLDQAGLDNVESADLITVQIPHIGQALIVDTRTTKDGSPKVLVRPLVGSAVERAHKMPEIRPELGIPETVASFRWEGSVNQLKQSELWEALIVRTQDSLDKWAICSLMLDSYEKESD